MTTATTTPPARTGSTAPTATRSHLRGSALLLAGQLLSVLIGMAVQVLIVRFLSRAQFGAFAYGLSVATMVESVTNLGMRRAVARYVPIYQERRDFAAAGGTVVLALGAILVTGAAVVLTVVGVRGMLLGTVINDRLAVSLLVLLIITAPLQSLSNLLDTLSAVFGSTQAIFLRKYVLAPGLRLLTVLAILGMHGSVTTLAIGYVLAAAAASVLYVWVTVGLLRRNGLLRHCRPSRWRLPTGEVFRFALPMMTNDLVAVAMLSTDTVMLGWLRGTHDVATIRAVTPVARLNELVLAAFTLMFAPAAARLITRRDPGGLDDLYWRTTGWVAVLGAPIFLVTFALAKPVTTELLGDNYSSSAPILAVLAVGWYAQCATGSNGLTLGSAGKVRSLMTINLAALAVNVALGLALIPRWGPMGAATAISVALVGQNIVKQWALHRHTGVRLLPASYVRLLAGVGLSLAVVVAVVRALDPSLWVGLLIVGPVSSLLLLFARPSLDIGATFPEVRRLPLVGALLAGD